MPVYRSTVDPYTADRRLYECSGCGTRVESDGHVGACGRCGAPVRNIAVARE